MIVVLGGGASEISQELTSPPSTAHTIDSSIAHHRKAGKQVLVYGGDTIGLQVIETPQKQAEWRTKLEEDARRATLRKNALWSFKRGLQRLGIPSDEVDSFNVQIDDLHFIYTEGLKIYLVVKCWRCPENAANQIVIERDLDTWADLVASYNERHTLCPVCREKEEERK